MAGHIVVRIEGDSSGLGRALRTAQRNVDNLHQSMSHLSKSASMAMIGLAAIAGSGVGAGVAGMALLTAGAGLTAGALGYMALENEKVNESFANMLSRFGELSDKLTAPMHVPLMDFFTDIGDIFENRLGPSITRISGMMDPFLDKLSTSLGTVAETLGNTMETMFVHGEDAFFAFIDGLNPVLEGLGELFKVLDDPAVVEFIKEFMNSIGLLLPELGKLLVALAPVGTAILLALLPVIQELTAFITDHVVPIMLTIANWLKDNPSAIYALVAAWVAFKAVMIATHLALGLIKAAMVVWSILRGIWMVGTGLMTAAQWALNASLMGFPLLWIIAAVLALIVVIWLIVKNWDTIKEWLGKAWEWIKEKFSMVWNAILDFFKGVWEKIKTWVSEAVENIKNKISEGFTNVKDKVVEIFNNVVDYIKSLPGKFIQMGKDLIQGLIDGIGNMGGALVQKAKDVAQGALDSIKGFFGIASPSKVMTEVGGWVGQGLVNGISSKESEAAKAARSLGKVVTGEFDANSPFQQAFKRAFDEVGITAINGIEDLEKMLLRSDITWDSIADGYGGHVLDSYIKQMNAKAGGAATYNVTVNAGISNPEETGRAVVKAVRDYERINGNGWRNG